MRFRVEQALARIGLPGLAMRMAHARVALDEAARAYDFAQTTRATRGWRTPSTSAAAEVGPALAVMRNRSRDLVRSNPWGIKARRQIPAHLVGKGVTPRPIAGADRTRRRAMDVWWAWSEETDAETGLGFAAQQSLIAGTIFESGEGLVLWDPAPDAPGGWTTRVLEPDYLDETMNERSRNGSGQIVNGIEFDAAGRRVAYHLFRDHPGDLVPGLLPRRERVRVEARFVDHVFEVLRPGQTRGVPFMAAAGLRLRDLDDYLEAERWRKKVTAAFAVFLKTPAGPAQSSLGQVRTETTPEGPRAVERIAPGTIKRLRPGEEPFFVTPPSDQGLEGYIKAELMAVAAGIGAPYAEFTGDLRNANYSSMRVGRLEFYTLIDMWQSHMLKPMLLRRAWLRVQGAAGVPNLPAEWSFPKRPWVDPEAEINAEIKAIRAGLMSQPDALAARGDDWRETLAEQAQFLAEADRLNLVLDTDPKQTSQAGLTQLRQPGSQPPDTEPSGAGAGTD
jgi:lambda family phage portal protein